MEANVDRTFLSRTILLRPPSCRFMHLVIALITVSIQLQSTSGSFALFSDFETFPGMNFTCPNVTIVTPCVSAVLCALTCLESQDCSGFSASADITSHDLVCRLCLGDGVFTNGIVQMESQPENEVSFWVKRTLLFLDPIVDDKYEISDRFEVGQIVQVLGTPTRRDEFSIRFKYEKDNYNTPINIKPYFDYQGRGEKTVIRHKLTSDWIVDAIVPVFPFREGQLFEVLILMMPTKYRIYADRQFLHDLEFDDQSFPASISYFQFMGNATITHVIY